jgi:hypothetical protein
MPTFADIRAAVKTRLEAALPTTRFTYPNGDVTLPDEAATFVYVEVLADRPEIVGFGGGLGQNLQRTTGRIEAHVMVPSGGGTEEADDLAEDICAVFRGTRTDGLDCIYGAQVIPQEGKTEDGVYAHVCSAAIEFSFDQSA